MSLWSTLGKSITEAQQERRDEMENKIVKCFGDSQQYDGGWFAEYDGKWIDVTNDVENVKQLFLDTIEKAKPEEQDESVMVAQPIGGCPNFGSAREAAGFNQGVSVFESNLKKEIGK